MTKWLALAFALLGTTAAQAEIYPSRPVTIVVPAAPGGVTDLLGRVLAQRLTAAWGQQVITENKPGANNQIAAEYVAKAPPDGHTLLIGPEVAFSVNPSLYAKLNYDPVKDFAPITGLVIINHALILHPSAPVENVKDLIALAKAKPGEINYGTYGPGSSGHLNMEMLRTLAGVNVQAVHYKGATPALTDVIAGHIQMMFISLGSAVPPWRAGQVKLIAIGARARLPALPEVPTVAESGPLPGFEAVSWFGLFAPAGTPRAVIDKINGEVRRTLADPTVQQSILAPQFFTPIAGSPEDLADFIKADALRWAKVIRDAKVKVD